jgi:uncharacterized RDD family membrane protein YckC
MDQRPEQQPEWTTQSQQTAGQVPRAAPMEGERPLPLHQGRRLASWGSRVVSYIIDAIFGLLLAAPGGILLGIGEAIHGGVAGALIAIGGVLLAIGVIVQIWQSGWRQGALGQSWGKVIMGLRTVDAESMRPIGGPKGLLRWLVDTVIGWFGILWILNYLWPLWDQRNQTWADKAVGSVVLAR